MTDRELFEKALEALEWNLPVIEDYGDHEQLSRQHRAITVLRERLAQPEQQPVAWVDDRIHGWPDCFVMQPDPPHTKPLYTSPPQRKPEQEPIVKWDVSAPLVVHPHPAFQAAPPQRKPLTDEDMKLLWAKHGYKSAMCKPFARAIEAAHGIKGEA